MDRASEGPGDPNQLTRFVVDMARGKVEDRPPPLNLQGEPAAALGGLGKGAVRRYVPCTRPPIHENDHATWEAAGPPAPASSVLAAALRVCSASR